MAKSISVRRKKKRGRPPTGTDPLIAVRSPPELTKKIDAWAKANSVASRSEAVRQLLEKALADLGK